MPKKHELRDRVYEILEQYPETRNCDARLVEVYWVKHNSSFLWTLMDDKSPTGLAYAVPIRNLNRLQPASAIERMRRHIQNKMGRFWPTDPKVARRRRMNMEEWKERMAALTPPTL